MTKYMTTTFVAGLALGATALLLPGTASAQPDSGFGDPVAPTAQPQPQPAPQPQPQPQPQPPAPVYQPAPAPPAPPPPPPPQPAPAAQAYESPGEPATARPVGMSVGLGISYLLGGAELDRPDGASVRFRLDGGLTLEPFVRLATHGQSTETDAGDFKNAQNEVAFGSNVRLPLASRGKVDLVAQAGAALAYFANDPDGDDNDDSSLALAIDYGLGVEYWINHNWCLSFTARNPFVSYVSRNVESPAGDQTDSDTDIGLIWDPGIDAALHLFY